MVNTQFVSNIFTSGVSIAIVILHVQMKYSHAQMSLQLNLFAAQPPAAGLATFEGTSITIYKGGKRHSCSAITSSLAPTPFGKYCIRRQGEEQRTGFFGQRPEREKWYLLEPQFETRRSRMHLHLGSNSVGCITVTNKICFDNLSKVINLPGIIKGFGFDGYPPGNAENVNNSKTEINCVAILFVHSLNGIWEGTATSNLTGESFPYQWVISQKGNQVYGTISIGSDKDTATYSMQGYFDKGSLNFEGMEFLVSSPGSRWCIIRGQLEYRFSSNGNPILSGTYKPHRVPGGCPTDSGTIFLKNSSISSP